MDYIQIIKFNFLTLELRVVPIIFTIPSRYPQNILIHPKLKLLFVILKPIPIGEVDKHNPQKGILSIRNLDLVEIKTIEIPFRFCKVFLSDSKKKDIMFDIFGNDGSIKRVKINKNTHMLDLSKVWKGLDRFVTTIDGVRHLKLEKHDNVYYGVNNKFELISCSI